MSCFALSPLQALIVFSSSWLAALVSHDHTLLFIGEHTVLQVCSSCLRAYYPEKAALYPFGATRSCKLSIHDSSLKNIDPWLQKTVPPKNQKRLPEGSLHQLAEGEGFEPSLPRLEAKRFSRPPHSAALPPFQVPLFATKCVAEFVKRKRSRERFW